MSWPVVYPNSQPYAGNVMDRSKFEEMATSYLWNWTGRTYGTGPEVLRPCRLDRPYSPTFWGRGPYPRASLWASGMLGLGINFGGLAGLLGGFSCGSCRGDQCSCGPYTASLNLNVLIVSVTQILIDGLVIDPAGYRVDDRHILVRTDPLNHGWPVCQDLSLPSTEVGTWEVSLVVGNPVPIGGQIAAGLLAIEMSKAAAADSTCALPRRVQSIIRQGVTMQLLDQFQDLASGHTGIWLVDSWIASLTAPPRASRVYSPDLPRNRYQVRTTS